jgi:hypothetical protein
VVYKQHIIIELTIHTCPLDYGCVTVFSSKNLGPLFLGGLISREREKKQYFVLSLSLLLLLLLLLLMRSY